MRRKIGEAERVELLKRYRESGQRQKDFCLTAGISVSFLQKCLRAENPKGKFVEVQPSRSQPEPQIEIAFRDGTILRVSCVSR